MLQSCPRWKKMVSPHEIYLSECTHFYIPELSLKKHFISINIPSDFQNEVFEGLDASALTLQNDITSSNNDTPVLWFRFYFRNFCLSWLMLIPAAARKSYSWPWPETPSLWEALEFMSRQNTSGGHSMYRLYWFLRFGRGWDLQKKRCRFCSEQITSSIRKQ